MMTATTFKSSLPPIPQGDMQAVILRRSQQSASSQSASASPQRQHHHCASVERVAIPQPRAGYALVRLVAVALNKRDEWMRRGLYPQLQFNGIMGADGCGVLVTLGTHIGGDAYFRALSLIGQPVLINPTLNWGARPDVPSPEFNVLGTYPHNGTFAEYIAVPVDRIHPIPAHLSPLQAASLPLGALTAYRAVVSQGNVRAGDVVLITGIGGGVASFALLIAVSLGAHVIVTSSTQEKIDQALALGARAGFIYTNDDWDRSVLAFLNSSGKSESTGPPGREDRVGIDCAIDGAGGEGLNRIIGLLKQGGRLVSYGATKGLCKELNLSQMFLKNLSLRGTSMGNDVEFDSMLRHVQRYQLKPVIDSVIPFASIDKAFDRVGAKETFGRVLVVLDPELAGPAPLLSDLIATKRATAMPGYQKKLEMQRQRESARAKL